MKNSNFLNNLKNDLPSSVVVFFVAVPLCLGIALASGAPPFSGLVAGVIGGIIVGFISGSSLGVSGPAAGLAAIVLAAISSLGSFENFLVAVVIAGVFQVILGLLRAGIIGYYFPTSVIKGMLSGIGIIIVLKQIPHFFGYDKDPEGDWDFIQVDGENTFSEILNAINHITPGSLLIATIGLLIILLWDNILAKKHTFFKLIQGPFVAVVLGVLFVVFFGDHATLGIAKTHLVNIPAPEEFSGWVNVFSTPNFSAITDINVWVVAGTMAIVASLETLLSVEATDKLDPQKRTTPTNRELFAQGTGNIVSGMIGGLPITQVIVRSSANIQSGGKTKTSAILHGFLIITTVLFIPGILNLIPLSVLAAVLFVVGYKLAKPAVFKKMFNLGWSQFTPYIATIIVIVWKDLLWGIGVGLVLAFFNVLFKSFKNNYFLHKETPKGETGTIKMTLPEEVSFLNKATIKKELDDVPVDSHLEIDVRNNVFVDYDIAEIFADYSPKAKERNIHINIITQDEVISNPDDFYDFFLSKTYSAKNKIKKMKTQTKETQSQLTPTKVQQILVEGNNRFMKAEMAKRNLLEQMKATTDGQYPHSVILSCIDSRTSSELIFDQGIGDIFNTRVAGNVINDDVLGSIEYSCKVAGSKLVVVLGHSKCGAVTSACQHIELGNITALLKKIQPAVDTISSKVEDITAPESVQMVADENVKHAIKEIREKSEILAQMEKDGEIKIVGGMYNIESGKVTFFD